jgi:hypothetical protein
MKRIGGLLLFVLLRILLPSTGFCAGQIIAYAVDTSASGAPPPAATAILDGTTSQAFGTNLWVCFSNVTAGTHTVEVSCVASGYLLQKSPNTPDAVNDPNSDYGNPRHIEVTDDETVPGTFRFDPNITISATVRDAWTMERLEGAGVECVFEGSTGSVAVCKYPSTATYATNWSSDFTGSVQPGPVLYLHDYDIQVALSGYQMFTSNQIITCASAGDTFALGEIFLIPVDNNTNLIADVWETLYFGAGSNVPADADADADGMSNRAEYVAGTDPTNELSVLNMISLLSSTGLALKWNTESWRTYRISGTTHIATGEWVQVAGSWEATNGQPDMIWMETNLDLSWNSNYRVDVMPCTWQGTNQTLINTNYPFSGGGEGGTNLPPLP